MTVSTNVNSKSIIEKIWERIQKQPERYVHYTFLHHDYDSPRAIIPSIQEWINPKSVVDVGCGLGAWLKIFAEHGVEETLGIDGDYLDLDKLVIPQEDLLFADLEKLDTFPTDRKFDLAVCLEVAEHLDEGAAKNLVSFLTHLADAVVFSAAIPLQGGINHINEQWPTYWQELFAEEGFEFFDLIRPKFWDNKKIKWWYRQNMFLACKKGKFDFVQEEPIRNLVHPELFHFHMKITGR